MIQFGFTYCKIMAQSVNILSILAGQYQKHQDQSALLSNSTSS